MIWERYLFKECGKTFIFFLGCFFFVYAVLDYSTHMQDFIRDKDLQLSDIALYYGAQFVKRATLLLPLALLVATIKVLTTLNTHHELLALQIGGLRLKKILRPFFLLASLCTLFNFANVSYFTPTAFAFLQDFGDRHFHTSALQKKEPFHILYLPDQSKIIYQKIDRERNAFFDVIWLRSSADIWKIKYLSADPTFPMAYFADHLLRDAEGFFKKMESFEEILFKDLKWEKTMTQKEWSDFESRSLGELYHLYFQKNSTTIHDKAEILAELSFKLLIPFLSLLVVLAAAPYSCRFSRGIPLFFLYAVLLFGYLAVYLLLDAAVILGKNHIVNSFWSIFVPFAIIASVLLGKFKKI